MNNKFLTYSISVSILLVSISISFYLFKVLPDINKQKLNLEIQQNIEAIKTKCTELGKEQYAQELKISNNKTSFGVPVYFYNEKLSQCLYENVFIAENYTSNYVVDLYTNKPILESDYSNSKLQYGLTKDEFNKKAYELMN